TQQWQIALLVVASVAFATFVIFVYRKDCAEAGRGWAVLLAAMRLMVLLGALIVFLKPERRHEQPVVQNSRALVLVDTSSSMAARADYASLTRVEQVVEQLADERLLGDVRRGHDVIVAGFDSDLRVHPLLAKKSHAPSEEAAEDASASEDSSLSIEWAELLSATGSETLLVDSLRKFLHQQRSEPLSGVIVLSDGGDTSDTEIDQTVSLARDLGVPILTVGVGTERRERNVAISGVSSPALVYPGDKFQITARIRAQDFARRRATIRVFSQDASSRTAVRKPVAKKTEILGADGEDVPVVFDITPAEEEIGRRLYTVEVDAFSDDIATEDNTWGPFPIEIVEQRLKVLLIAGGPTREYRFLRNQLRRDRQMDVVEWPQWADPGLTHASHTVIHEFPASLAELDEYDVLVAIDPDWQRLATEQLSALERWVGEQAGGMIAVAGPIYTDQWTYDARMAKLRTLYPVKFSQRFSLLSDEPAGSAKAWPLEFTNEGLRAKFLWLDDDAVESRTIWSQFEGVFGTYRVRGGDLGATVYARYSDPQAGDAPYMAEQIYGAGRVFFIGSGELWRLRALSDGYFETFYTKLIRHVSQHRLNRQNSRGMLLVERQPYAIGSTVTVRAQLKDERFEPLRQASVSMDIVRPDRSKKTIDLVPETAHEGMFVGQFAAEREGLYQLVLPVPGSIARSPISRCSSVPLSVIGAMTVPAPLTGSMVMR
ncbi:MAG: VWA domain-containing protein, partial [Pirellulales bacterium]|nr:VWA domain-containing protein [Pirellulales bacterium]